MDSFLPNFFTQHNYFEAYPCMLLPHPCLLYCRLGTHCMNMIKIVSSFTCWWTFGLLTLDIIPFLTLVGVKWYLTVVYISLMTNVTKHFFVYLLAKVFTPFAHFLIESLAFLLNCKSSLYILDISPLPYRHIDNIFPSLWLVFQRVSFLFFFLCYSFPFFSTSQPQQIMLWELLSKSQNPSSTVYAIIWKRIITVLCFHRWIFTQYLPDVK